MLKCEQCKKELDIVFQRNRIRRLVFCSEDCVKAFASEKPCSRCQLNRSSALFLPKKRSGYYFLSEVCNICKATRVRKVVLNFSDFRQSFEHIDVDSVEPKDGVLRIYSRKDSKEYLYPLVNLIKIEILH